jgi:hypothetical protein
MLDNAHHGVHRCEEFRSSPLPMTIMTIRRPTHRTLRWLALACLTLVAAAMPATMPAPEPERPLARLAFMAGCWRGDAGVDKSIEEQWTAADSDVMLATTRYLDDNTGRTRAWEFSRIVADSAGITLFPSPLGTQQGRFRMTSSPDGEARFEDPAHDFPKRIIYRMPDRRTLVAHLDGGEGSHQAIEIRMQRVPCPSASTP